MDLLNRALGALLGLATGDALGAAVEFKPPGTFPPVSDMTGGGPHGLAPGQWTDDTSMALCLAESLIECKGFDAADAIPSPWLTKLAQRELIERIATNLIREQP